MQFSVTQFGGRVRKRSYSKKVRIMVSDGSVSPPYYFLCFLPDSFEWIDSVQGLNFLGSSDIVIHPGETGKKIPGPRSRGSANTNAVE